MKRTFDIISSALGLALFSPLFILIALLVRRSGPVIFSQERIGRGFVPFRLYKFRSMVTDAPDKGPEITAGGDMRVTPVGRFLRRYKLDELPQLFNVLKGDMSMVGPRPEVRKYVELFRADYEQVLKVRPGITDPASLAFSDEESVFGGKDDPEEYYTTVLLPEKLRLARGYVKKVSLGYDIRLLVRTMFKLLYPAGRINNVIESLNALRRPIVVLTEMLVFVLCSYAAFFIRFDGEIPPEALILYFKALPLLLVIRTALLFVFRLDRGLWRYFSARDIRNVVFAAVVGTVIFYLAVRHVFGVTAYPRSVYAIDLFLNILVLSGLRLVKQFNDKVLAGEEVAKKRVVVIGAGDAADMLIRDIEQSSHYPYRIVALVDDNPLKKNAIIRGVPVLGGRAELEEIVAREEPEEFIIAIPTLTSPESEKLVGRLREFGLPIKTVPGLWGVLTGRDSISMLKLVEPEDVLFREPTKAGGVELKGAFKGKRVMITGAGGSIGSELTLQVAGLDPDKLILFERHEESLYRMDLKLKALCNGGEPSHVAVIGDVTDKRRLKEVMVRHRPDVVFHAAAYKHVPMMEQNPYEAFRTNVLGTRAVAEVSSELGVERFVLVSTDKAVNPANIMGKTKKIAERVVKSYAEKNTVRTRFITVRFGNVLGSSGSVVPLFNEQIKRGGPVTVTHPEINRYFMTIPEAVSLVMQAATMGSGGEVFVLDMGEPVKIVDLARRMISLYGYRPGIDIEIKFTGLRPGEKLYEELFNSAENIEQTGHPKISMAVAKASPQENFLDKLDTLYGTAPFLDETHAGQWLDELAKDGPVPLGPRPRPKRNTPEKTTPSPLVFP